jgi:hypothetical protein
MPTANTPLVYGLSSPARFLHSYAVLEVTIGLLFNLLLVLLFACYPAQWLGLW